MVHATWKVLFTNSIGSTFALAKHIKNFMQLALIKYK